MGANPNRRLCPFEKRKEAWNWPWGAQPPCLAFLPAPLFLMTPLQLQGFLPLQRGDSGVGVSKPIDGLEQRVEVSILLLLLTVH